MAEEDNFDIDIYGDGDDDGVAAYGEDTNLGGDQAADRSNRSNEYHEQSSAYANDATRPDDSRSLTVQDDSSFPSSTQDRRGSPHDLPAQASRRKEGHDDRPTDPGATVALFVSDLSWWITDDEIRGWANQSNCEDELEELTFSEHKVNGKSKGQVYILTSSPQAATAIKRQIDSFADAHKYKHKFNASYSNPNSNPFKTLPKDASTRNNNNGPGNRSAPSGFNQSTPTGPAQGGYNQGGFRGGRGGFNRGGGPPNLGSYGRGGMPIGGGYQGGGGGAMGGFQNSMGNMPGYGGFGGRGGMMNNMRGGGGPMGMRGGRGGMNNMMGMPMGGMPMGGVPPGPIGGIGMPPMNGPMSMQGGYPNQNFYPPQGDSNWNPHGAKRTRQE